MLLKANIFIPALTRVGGALFLPDLAFTQPGLGPAVRLLALTANNVLFYSRNSRSTRTTTLRCAVAPITGGTGLTRRAGERAATIFSCDEEPKLSTP